MTEEKDRPEKEPEETKEENETGERENSPVDKEPAEDWEREKQQSKEIVSKALDKVKNKLEDQ